MPDVSLLIAGPEGKRVERPDPRGSILGRDPKCDIRLDHEGVSRIHARLHRDPFGRWLIEDLDSRNGVHVDGRRIDARTPLPGRKAVIAPFTLTLDDDPSRAGSREPRARTFTIVAGEGCEEVVPYRADARPPLGTELLHALNAFTEDLLTLAGPAELYARACRHLVGAIGASVALLRLPAADPLPERPEVLVWEAAPPGSTRPEDILFSRGVLNAARASGEPVMARSHPRSDRTRALTVVDDAAPRVVFAARVNRIETTADLLYVDLPAPKLAEGLFDFIEAAARQIDFAQKRLFFSELEKRGAALREANRELLEKDRIKDEYVFRVTHDIKGHIGAIQSCLSVAAADSGLGSPEQKAEFLERASRRTTQLSAFIADLLRLTRMRLSGDMESRAFALADVLATSLDTASPQAADKRIDLGGEIDPALGEMTGDELSIAEVVTNMLFNAIKYTPEGGRVALAASARDGRAVIEIRDTGIGIPPDDLDRVFDEFFRAGNAVAFEKEGTGLGLALAKQIVERHGGAIAARNNPDAGATFVIELPLARP